MKPIHLVWKVLFFFECVASSNGSIDIELREELAHGTDIFNLRDRLKMSITDFPDVQFKVVHQYITLLHSSQRKSKNSNTLDLKWIEVEPSSGRVMQEERADRESLCLDVAECYIVLKVVVISPTEQKHQNIHTINFHITDINDNIPSFPSSSIDVSIPETAPVGHEINLDEWQAVDSDNGINSSISYSILPPSDYFKVHTFKDQNNYSHLRLIVVKSLDYEEEKIHRLTIHARDGGSPSKSSNLAVLVEVEDENDNYPIFDQKRYEVDVREDCPTNEIIVVVHAEDEDRGIRGEVRYLIRENLDDESNLTPIGTTRCPVIVNNETGAVILRDKLNHKLHNGFKVIIEAVDRDLQNPLTGRTLLVLHVNDVNDNRPAISISFIVKSKGKNIGYVNEDTPIGSYLAHITTSDADEGQNGEVTLSVETVFQVEDSFGNFTELGKFKIGSDGLLQTCVKFDRETQNSYDVIIQARDKGTPPRSSTASIKIIILDINEYQPVFEHPEIIVNIPEDQEVGSLVAIANASDKDSLNSPSWRLTEHNKIEKSYNGEVIYGITLALISDDSNEDIPVVISSKTGKVTLIRSLDYETKQKWKLTVTARDNGRPLALQSTCSLIINVYNVNDNEPTFVEPEVDNSTVYASTLNSPSVFASLKALDFGLNEKTKMRYSFSIKSKDGNSMVRQSYLRMFKLDRNTGKFSLDASGLHGRGHLGLYKSIISVSDSGNPPQMTSMTLYIDVIDTPVLQHGFFLTSKVNNDAENLLFLYIGAGLGGLLMILIVLMVVIIILRRRKVADNHPNKTYDKTRQTLSQNTPSEEQVALTVKAEDDSKSSCNQSSNDGSSTFGKYSVRRASMHLNSDKPYVYCDELQTNENEEKFIQVQPKNLQSSTSRYNPNSLQSPVDSRPKIDFSDVKSSRGYDIHTTKLNGINNLGRQCTKLCRLYGHSDACWMPPEDEKNSLSKQKSASVRKDSVCSMNTSSSSLSYLKVSNNKVESKNFNDVFLNGDVSLPDVIGKARSIPLSDGGSIMSSIASSGNSRQSNNDSLSRPPLKRDSWKSSQQNLNSRRETVARSIPDSNVVSQSTMC